MSETLTKLVWNGETDEWSELPLTEAELEQRAIDAAAAEQQRQAQEAEATAKAEARASLEAKLTALGITADELAAL